MGLMRGLTALAGITIFLSVACSDNNKKTTLRPRGTARVGVGFQGGNPIIPGGPGMPGMPGVPGVPGSPSGSGGVPLPGRFQAAGAGLQSAADGLVSATNDPMTTVGYMDQPQTGLFFGGRVALNTGRFQPGVNANVTSGTLYILIWDSEAVSTQYGILLPFSQAGGTLSGSQVNLYFDDGYGTVNLIGNISGNQFNGQATFANRAHFAGAQPASGLIGTFAIDACSLFVCQ